MTARTLTAKAGGRSNSTTTGNKQPGIAGRCFPEANAAVHSDFGHDKSLEIKPYAALPHDERPTLLYAGDGVSDLSAAAETDLLFAKKGNGTSHLHPSLPFVKLIFQDLVDYCKKRGMPFTVFEDWSSILDVTKDILSGKRSVKNVALEQERTVHES